MFAICVCTFWWLHLCTWTAHATPTSLRPLFAAVGPGGFPAGAASGPGLGTPVGASPSPSPTPSSSQGNGFPSSGSGILPIGAIGAGIVVSATGGGDQGILIACQNRVCVAEEGEYVCDNMPATIGDDIAWLYSDDRTQSPVVIQESGITPNESNIPINFAPVGNQPPITCRVVSADQNNLPAACRNMRPTMRYQRTTLGRAVVPEPPAGNCISFDDIPPTGVPHGSCCRPCPRTRRVERSLSCCGACSFIR
ncbi:hypothetical protein FGB62_74g14 [Gracilaria domingensis]|nr:hypothetical protein FGB62_74g14 [Gracilaria domingensis]